MAKIDLEKIAEASARRVEDEFLRVSFEYIDLASDYFFVHGVFKEYYSKFFDCINEIQLSKNSNIAQQNHPCLNVKSIFNNNKSLHNSFPESVVEKVKQKLFVQCRNDESALAQALEITGRAFEVRVAKTYGRIHGFLWNNTFYIVWIDPAHNLYYGENTPKKYSEYATVKCFSPEATADLQDKVRKLQTELGELYEAWANGAPEPA